MSAASAMFAIHAGKVPTRTELLELAEYAKDVGESLQELQVSTPLRATVGDGVNLARFFDAKAEWSRKTFGEHRSHVGVVAHIRKELLEIERAPADGVEWCDVVLLAMDGAWRAAGLDGAAFVELLAAKQKQNTERAWPKSADPHAPIEHVRTLDERLAVAVVFAREPEPTREQLIAERDEARADAKRWAERVKLVESRSLEAVRALTGTR